MFIRGLDGSTYGLALVKGMADLTIPYCVCSQIFFDIESVRSSYLYHWIANKMLFPMVYKTLVLEL